LLGFRMIVLGRWAWNLRPHLRLALLITHGVLLLAGTLAVVAGVLAIRAAERSTASGGGLLSPSPRCPWSSVSPSWVWPFAPSRQR
jgi:hypothetical protein